MEENQKQKYIDFAVKISVSCIEKCSQEVFRDWCLSLSLANQNNSYFLIEKYFSKLLVQVQKINGLGKRFRYHKLLKIFLQYNQTWSRKYALEGLDMLINTEIQDIKECDENIDLFAEILCSCIIVRMNIKKIKDENIIIGGIQQYIDNNQIILQDQNSGFENNQKIIMYIEQIFSKLQNAKDESTKKLYSHMTFRMLDSLSVKKQNDLFWSYFRPLFIYILDNKPDNVNEIEILKVMSQNEYPKNIRKDIVGILGEKFQSENWVSRQKVLIFAKNFFYFEEYQENLVDVNVLLKNALLDKNHSVSLLAIDCLSDILKIATEEEQNNIFQKFKLMAQIVLSKDKHSDEYKKSYHIKLIGIQVLMALLLAFQDQIYGWTEEALKEIIHSKNANAVLKKKLKNSSLSIRKIELILLSLIIQNFQIKQKSKLQKLPIVLIILHEYFFFIQIQKLKLIQVIYFYILYIYTLNIIFFYFFYM
ncbi:hypothetical protein IMG5_076360 [Ichthyophthirius multifiliis]|uniref:Armadillo-type fold n=1 Tax=Ichthyophthirius multifiliis TaxID=5932 RepID=G0QQA5_ICHMU|nr:hypothetical protein IMG5_076360 [Ichthyophthirius multifiliis]EGR32606.1 hypothetical protein IMG5_076360 [Ichthyophthirius multifiliis]|eukprot:XP_004036592.1 hypothetical protein IMG5_076360 [Ichthyophthirius multifiliis]